MQFQCPGENYPINRAVHLARLASFFPACRNCPHREETGTLPKRTIQQLAIHEKRQTTTRLFTSEGAAGVYRNELTTDVARRLAMALGVYVQAHVEPGAVRPGVVLAADDRPLSPEFVAASSEGLRLSGCDVMDIGAATSGCLSAAIAHARADGGLLIGNPTASSHLAGFKFWGVAGLPLSAGGGLDELEQIFHSDHGRPTRSSGRVSRMAAEPVYLESLREYFHALRPLKLVLDTGCSSLVRYLRQLTENVACQTILVQDQPREAAQRAGVSRSTDRSDGPGGRLRHLSRSVRAAGAHFGIWVDGDGEACRIVDERGTEVAAERTLALFGRNLLTDEPRQPIVIEGNKTEQNVCSTIASHPTIVGGTTRAEMAAAVQLSGATLGGGSSGRFWFSAPLLCPDASTSSASHSPALGLPPAVHCDALRLIAWLLTVLSRADWSLSEAVASSLEPALASR